MLAIKTENIRKSFSHKLVLEDISLQIEQGMIFGLLGPSGSGKTTLIKILTGQLKPDCGRSMILGEDSASLGDEMHRRIGMMLDESGLYERLSCYDNLEFYRRLFHLNKADIMHALQRVQLEQDAKTTVQQLSKGMKQRLALARAIMIRPEILFLDEPTSGLDPATTLTIHDMLKDLREQGVTIFLTTHDMEEATALCDEVALLNEGAVIECDAPKHICAKYDTLQTITIITKDEQRLVIPNTADHAQEVYEAMKHERIKTIHSSEPNLATVFISLTGRELV